MNMPTFKVGKLSPGFVRLKFDHGKTSPYEFSHESSTAFKGNIFGDLCG
jgi:hypothetical protein